MHSTAMWTRGVFSLLVLSVLLQVWAHVDDGKSSMGRRETVTGGKVCTDPMCISGVVQGSTVLYVLQSTDDYPLAWMGMGFGNTMANTPMVIVWPNSGGNITLSQRQASGHIMPTVVANPPNAATLVPSLSATDGEKPKIAFTIHVPSGTGRQDLIWAFGTDRPSSASPDAILQQHLESGPFQLDLGGSIDSVDAASPANTPTTPFPSTPRTGLRGYQKYIVAHAVLCVVGFLFLLPLGVLIARYFRTFTHKWFNMHFFVQFFLAGPVIVAGVACGIQAVVKDGSGHVNDTHKKLGISLFVLYFVQVGLGGFIHWVKPKVYRGRLPQNYLHAVVGLVLIGLALYQVRLGYHDEWRTRAGKGTLPRGVNVVWEVWVVALFLLYAVGLAFLRRQFSQERASIAAAAARAAELNDQTLQGDVQVDRVDQNKYAIVS